MAIGDVYLAVLLADAVGATPSKNAFTYRDGSSIGHVGNANDLALVLYNQFLTPLTAMMSAEWVFIGFDVVNLFDPTDIGFHASPVAGNQTVETNVPFAAWAYRTNRVRRDIRRGQKRFPGVPENLATNGLPTSDATTLAADMVTALGQSIVGDADTLVLYDPIIVKRIPYVTPSGHDGYRLPISQLEMGTNYFSAIDWNFMGVSHQVTRRRN